jgi:hypothetical protein
LHWFGTCPKIERKPMKTYLYKGIRIPSVWKIVSKPHPFYPHNSCTDGDTKTIHLHRNDIDDMLAIAHESAHARRWEKNGDTKQITTYEMDPYEYHYNMELRAGIYELHVALKHGKKEELRNALSVWENTLFTSPEIHGRAAKRLMESRLWKRCNEFVSK